MALEKHMLQTHSLFEKAGEVFEGVAKLKERIAELEAERDSFEKSFNEMTEAYMKSQRALWIARAELCHRLDVDEYLRKHKKSHYFENFFTWNEACVAMEVAMCEIESVCRAKAEEYK